MKRLYTLINSIVLKILTEALLFGNERCKTNWRIKASFRTIGHPMIHVLRDEFYSWSLSGFTAETTAETDKHMHEGTSRSFVFFQKVRKI